MTPASHLSNGPSRQMQPSAPSLSGADNVAFEQRGSRPLDDFTSSQRVGSSRRERSRGSHDSSAIVETELPFLDAAWNGLRRASDVMLEMRQLAITSANNSEPKTHSFTAMQERYDRFAKELDEICTLTSADGQHLFSDWSRREIEIFSLPNSFWQLYGNLPVVTPSSLRVGGTSVASRDNAKVAINALDDALIMVSDCRLQVGLVKNFVADSHDVIAEYLSLGSRLRPRLGAEVAA